MGCTNTSVTIQKSGSRILLGRMHLMPDSLPSLTGKASTHSRMEFLKSHNGLAERTVTFSAILLLLLQVPMTLRGVHNTAHIWCKQPILYSTSHTKPSSLCILMKVWCNGRRSREIQCAKKLLQCLWLSTFFAYSYAMKAPKILQFRSKIPIYIIYKPAKCQGTSETGNVSCPSAHGAPTDPRDRRSRGQVPAECLEQKMLYAYTTVRTWGDFTLSRKWEESCLLISPKSYYI